MTARQYPDLAPLASLAVTWLDGGEVHQLVPGQHVGVCGQIPPLLLTLCPPCGDRCAACFDSPEEG